ncbi:5'(3')-deoxyribonucleotidase [Jeotgalibaca sp. MA1X17-3]|uniref:5' nucleotidase, NT5C type n=1 Tax=Jeotgalibaca sp. MA1X17-3 TaxID=2908211 RepID=UPI001F3C95CC|nr:5'(3')-deoxyribonucleotidase [Jeotgalibaca sp. MA1X17-3]UJF16126.1 5'(3')-deoxyribonucleotidase [Jeotgalibaca sp. MA1X17-3]
MGKKISIAIDMDDVLADTTGKLITVYNHLFNENYISEDFVGVDTDALFPKEALHELHKEFNKPGFTRDLTVKSHAPKVVEELNERYDVYIATAAMEVPGTFKDKYDWLKEHFPFLNENYFIFCGNKKVVQADYLIDDNFQQLKQFQGTGILYTATVNKGKDIPFIRMDNWLDVHHHFVDSYQDRMIEAEERRFKTFH